MPTYEYLCSSCQNEWEEVQRISEDALEICPKCGKNTAKRQISAGNFILKGGGWYADLYSSSPKPKGAGDGEKGGASAPTAKAEGGAAAAPAAAPAAAAPAKSDSGGSGSSGGGSSGGSAGSGSSSSSGSGGSGSSGSGSSTPK